MKPDQEAVNIRLDAWDFSDAVLLVPEGLEGAEAKAITVLIEETEKRTGIALAVTHEWPADNQPVIVAGTAASLQDMVKDYSVELEKLSLPGKEGYRLLGCKDERTVVLIVGADSRGMLYGIGKFLRKSSLTKQSLQVPANLSISSTPRQSCRGHQLGYRPKTNAYDAWSSAQFEQYIRELAIFGANSIEIMPPRTDDDATGPLMQEDPLKMMIRLSEIIDSYGLDTWVWYPNMAENYADPATIREELLEREEIFSKVPHIHAVFIPGSDPGELEPDLLFEWAAQVAELLQKYHPEAKLWISPQVMSHEPAKWLEGFLANVDKEPEWLGGLVFGPHVDITLPDLRRRIPDKYPIRRYEDITHNFHCQYPVVNWDLAFALTLGRESINPRPLAEKYIHNLLESYAIGNISYSEGINDDVNKFIWSDQDWDSKTEAIETLREFARFFIADAYTEGIAQGLLALEKNWEGPLAVNEGVDQTFNQWRMIEHSAPPEVLNNYRFQMGLLRAYYDAYIKRRLIYETELELEAMDALKSAPSLGALVTLEQAEAALLRAKTHPVAESYRQRCWELADELFKNIGAQLSVTKHQAIALGRGAFMDAIDFPLNDSRWLSAQNAIIREMDNEQDRLNAIDQIVNRTNPGPGGYYDNLGSYKGWQRVDKGKGWENDPGYLESPRMAHGIYLLQTEREIDKSAIPPIASTRHVNTLADTQLTLQYDHLDPGSSYSVKVTYVGDTASELSRDYKVTLSAQAGSVLHENVLVKQGQCTQIESPIPQEAFADGKLRLTFTRVSGFKRLNVSEIWIIRNGAS
ncbi:hypothetical protein [Paenibacillus radicis (ex Xue et al. 2023)]|uniref:Alpha glucuronidase N-terminal domain-containing protein n=1 Tax=Paenibacillus radicis (ex Xue et al. 2023) TaxID=2972489 RepID=A0ABT1YES3_9BACL|nr:hypothetical protein [Paenibacillus radicis (ex Xue et al. 2023)]MCR8631688.1 hypothetical protein [Paenibacillus radicis (ex Xue et al. 2023)]